MSKIDSELLSKIGEDSGLSPKEISQDELQGLHELNQGRIPTTLDLPAGDYLALAVKQYKLREKYSGIKEGMKLEELSRRGIQLDQNLETIFDAQPRNLTYGLFAPTYVEMMKSHKIEKEKPQVLLMGALTGDTSREFQQTVTKVYPKADTTVLDLEKAVVGAATLKEGMPFVQADVFQLPFKQGSFDEIHSNALLDKLANGSEIKVDIERALSSIYGLLSKKGSYLSVERVPYEFIPAGHIDEQDEEVRNNYIRFLTEIAKKVGFKSIETYPISTFETRNQMRSFLSEEGEPEPLHVKQGNPLMLGVRFEK